MEILKKKDADSCIYTQQGLERHLRFFSAAEKNTVKSTRNPKTAGRTPEKNVNQLKLKGTRLEVKASPRRGLVGGWERADRHWQHSSR